jgi:hypothetical protein
MGRSMTINGPGPVTPQDILAYQALLNVNGGTNAPTDLTTIAVQDSAL